LPLGAARKTQRRVDGSTWHAAPIHDRRSGTTSRS